MAPPRGIGRLTGAEVRASRARRHAADVAPIIQSIQAAGISTIRGITVELNRRGIPTATGKEQWQESQVLKVMRRLKLAAKRAGA
jgi:hypothetical protein